MHIYKKVDSDRPVWPLRTCLSRSSCKNPRRGKAPGQHGGSSRPVGPRPHALSPGSCRRGLGEGWLGAIALMRWRRTQPRKEGGGGVAPSSCCTSHPLHHTLLPLSSSSSSSSTSSSSSSLRLCLRLRLLCRHHGGSRGGGSVWGMRLGGGGQGTRLFSWPGGGGLRVGLGVGLGRLSRAVVARSAANTLNG